MIVTLTCEVSGVLQGHVRARAVRSTHIHVLSAGLRFVADCTHRIIIVKVISVVVFPRERLVFSVALVELVLNAVNPSGIGLTTDKVSSSKLWFAVNANVVLSTAGVIVMTFSNVPREQQGDS